MSGPALRFTEDLDCAALAGRAQSQLSKGRLDAAEADFLRVHAADPLHREAWLGRLEVARKRKDAAACRLLADEALAVLPGDQGIAEAAGRSLIDLERWSFDALRPRSQWFFDSVHLTEEGQAKLGRFVAAELAPILDGTGEGTGTRLRQSP